MTYPIRILLVEDDDFISRMYQTKFTHENLQFTTAHDGEEALKAATHTTPDIILLDIMLPKLNGWEVLERLKRNPVTKHIPVVLLTNIGSSEDIQKGFELGAIDYMIKAHFIPDEVVKKIKSVLQQ